MSGIYSWWAVQRAQIQSGKLEEILNRIWKQSDILGDGKEVLKDLKTNTMSHSQIWKKIYKLEMNTK